MLYVFKPFWSLLTKGGEAYELIVFKRVHMGGCFIFCFVFTTLVLIHLVLWVVTLKTRWSSATYLLYCDAMTNSACAMITSALISFCRHPFVIMHVTLLVTIFHAWWIIFISWRGSPQVQPAMCICIPKANYLYAHLQGEPLPLMKTIPYPLQFQILYPRWKLQPVCHQSPKRGRL